FQPRFWQLGQGPGLQHVALFKEEVIMQATRTVVDRHGKTRWNCNGIKHEAHEAHEEGNKVEYQRLSFISFFFSFFVCFVYFVVSLVLSRDSLSAVEEFDQPGND